VITDTVVAPGGGFGPAAGMLLYAAAVPERRGATVHRHSWSEPRPPAFEPPIESWVRGELTPLFDRVGGTPLVIGKSLGSYAAGVAADRALPAVWLTPILTAPWVPAALRRATAPFLLIGGTADQYWDGAAAARLTPHVLQVEEANHGMFLPGPVAASIDVLARMLAAIEEFLDTLG
jgi:pimeloyl-ACP methyl ester carboxylesterase